MVMALSGGLIRRYALDSDRLTLVRIEFDTPDPPFCRRSRKMLYRDCFAERCAVACGMFPWLALRSLDSWMTLRLLQEYSIIRGEAHPHFINSINKFRFLPSCYSFVRPICR